MNLTINNVNLAFNGGLRYILNKSKRSANRRNYETLQNNNHSKNGGTKQDYKTYRYK